MRTTAVNWYTPKEKKPKDGEYILAVRGEMLGLEHCAYEKDSYQGGPAIRQTEGDESFICYFREVKVWTSLWDIGKTIEKQLDPRNNVGNLRDFMEDLDHRAGTETMQDIADALEKLPTLLNKVKNGRI